ncbi:MAG TPA: ImmA/IrrE family metallo-endopeptidase [Bacteroidales bacterium]|nr:ImmA/IrrE family metallo-endopeptidase [Bacteroidales bacterium]
MRTEVNINADMLVWAISRAGYDLHEFSTKLPKIVDWIEGTKKPTIKQLEAFSKKVHIPFGYLFLQKPPIEEIPIPYFRSNGSRAEKVSLNVYDTIQLMVQRQDWLREYLKDNDFDKLAFVGAFNQINDVEKIVRDIRNVLNLEENWAGSLKTWEESLSHLVELIEDKGIITVFNGVVENNTSRPIDVEECRGFVLVDDYAPFMFVNNADSKSAQMFTIVHELAHIWTGHSAGFDFRKLQPADDPIEKLCDQIAAEFLVPKIALDEIWQGFDELSKYSRHFKVSEIVIARRALDLGKITKAAFFKFYEEYRDREFDKKNSQGAGGDFYATAKKRVSVTFAHHIERAVKSGDLLYRDAYKLTSMKGDTFDNFFNKHLNK